MANLLVSTNRFLGVLVFFVTTIFVSCTNSIKKQKEQDCHFSLDIKNHDFDLKNINGIVPAYNYLFFISADSLILFDSGFRRVDINSVKNNEIIRPGIVDFVDNGLRIRGSGTFVIDSTLTARKTSNVILDSIGRYYYDDAQYSFYYALSGFVMRNKIKKTSAIITVPTVLQVLKVKDVFYIICNGYDAAIFYRIDNPDSLATFDERHMDTVTLYRETKNGWSEPIYTRGWHEVTNTASDTTQRYLHAILGFTFRDSLYAIVSGLSSVFVYQVTPKGVKRCDTLLKYRIDDRYPRIGGNGSHYYSYFEVDSLSHGMFQVDSTNKIVLHFFKR